MVPPCQVAAHDGQGVRVRVRVGVRVSLTLTLTLTLTLSRCGGLAGHYCSDIYGESGFSPCTCHAGTGNCATWGTGIECHQVRLRLRLRLRLRAWLRVGLRGRR